MIVDASNLELVELEMNQIDFLVYPQENPLNDRR